MENRMKSKDLLDSRWQHCTSEKRAEGRNKTMNVGVAMWCNGRNLTLLRMFLSFLEGYRKYQ